MLDGSSVRDSSETMAGEVGSYTFSDLDVRLYPPVFADLAFLNSECLVLTLSLQLQVSMCLG